MVARHAKLFRISANAFKTLRAQVAAMAYSPKKRTGFLVDENTANRLSGRFMHVKIQKIKSINPDSLIEEISEQPVLLTCTFATNMTTGVIYCEERRSDLNLLEDVFNGLEGVSCELEDFATDVTAIYRNLRDSYGKVDLRTLRIKDYLGREGLLTTASFKLMEPSKEEEIMRKYANEILAFSATLMTDVGKKMLSVSSKGSIRVSEDVPEDIIETLLNYLPQFHEEVEVNTVEV